MKDSRVILALTTIVALGGLFASTRAATFNPRPVAVVRPMIRTDRESYRFERDTVGSVLKLSATLTNRLPHKLYVVRCQASGLSAIEKRVGDKWRTAWQPVCDLGGRSITVVAPGKKYRDARRIALGPWHPTFTVSEIGGVYRARYDVYTRYGPDPATQIPVGDPAPEEARVSNEFKIAQP